MVLDTYPILDPLLYKDILVKPEVMVCAGKLLLLWHNLFGTSVSLCFVSLESIPFICMSSLDLNFINKD